MITNKEVLENGYWSSSSSSSSIRSEFDDEYYRMKPPLPNFEEYLERVVVINEGQFPQSEAQLQNVNLSNENKIQSNVQQKPDYKNLAVLSSKSETNGNGRKAPDRQRLERGVPHTNGNDMQHKFNHSNDELKINTTEQNQNLTTNENFRRGPNYVGPFTNRNANGNTPQYSTPQSSITKNNAVEEILSNRIIQKPTTLYSINSSPNTAGDTRRERIKPLPFQSNTPRGVKIENKQLYNVPLPKHSTSTATASITGRCNTLSRRVDTASGNSKSHSSNHSKTYNTFLAVQPTASRNNTVQVRQPASRNNTLQVRQPAVLNPVVPNAETTTESAKEKCYNICCFWLCCCA